MKPVIWLAVAALLITGCDRDEQEPEPAPETEAPPVPLILIPEEPPVEPVEPILTGPELLIPRERLDVYKPVRLTADLDHLSQAQLQKLGLLIQASDIMDELFWRQAYGRSEELLDVIDDPAVEHFARINYGPWDRLDGNRPFLAGFGEKPPGARFYPSDMSRDEFEEWDEPDKFNPYSFVRRDGHDNLELVPYAHMFAPELSEAARLLRGAADLAENSDFADYLRARARALVTDDYQDSDRQWLNVRGNDVELVIGAIENYEDGLFGSRTAYESFVLIKDREWSRRLDHYAELLPGLQEGLPIPEEYRSELPGTDSHLGVYDAIYYAGDANAGAKTIAINLPNDEAVQAEKGTRRLQIRNAMEAKFEHILLPIAGLLIDSAQKEHIHFDAFFNNIMFHEVAHGLGIHYTLDEEQTVRESLQDLHSALEEAKADILGLYMIRQLNEAGQLEGDLMDHYVTFMAGIFRSVRFGAASAHGQANMIAFNYFRQAEAFSRDEETGTYRVNEESFEEAVENLARDILMLQAQGDYDSATTFTTLFGTPGELLEADIQRINRSGIPVDIVFEQGPEVAGIDPLQPSPVITEGY